MESMAVARLITSVHKLRHRLEIDRPVLFGLMSKIWSLCAGPVTALLVVAKFSPEVQGYYYTFGTIVALQVFVEMGLGTVIQQFASHEWSLLALDKAGHIVGNSEALSRLTSITRIAFKWYAIGSVIVIIGLGIGGYIFFSSSLHPHVTWGPPWLFLSFLTGVNILLVPAWSLLEGCNQVSNLYVYRFLQGAITSICVWIAILLDAELWTAVVSSATMLLCASVFLGNKYRAFFKTLLLYRASGSHGIGWRSHMFPMQWRIALSWITGYFVYSFFTPVLFKYSGPVVAGQFGLTWSVIGIVGSISSSWIAPRVPRWAMLVAERNFEELDKVFFRTVRLSASVSLLVGFVVWIFVYLLYVVESPFAGRLLEPLPTALFLAGQLAIVIPSPYAVYLRAHKKEPLVLLSVLNGILTGLLTIIVGKYHGVVGMGLCFLMLNLILQPLVVLVWHRCRKEWHCFS